MLASPEYLGTLPTESELTVFEEADCEAVLLDTLPVSEELLAELLPQPAIVTTIHSDSISRSILFVILFIDFSLLKYYIILLIIYTVDALFILFIDFLFLKIYMHLFFYFIAYRKKGSLISACPS